MGFAIEREEPKTAVYPTLCADSAPERLIHGKAYKGATVVSLPRLQSKDVPRP